MWLDEQIKLNFSETELSIPVQLDGKEYNVFDLKGDQEQIAAFILAEIKKVLRRSTKNSNQSE